MPSPSSSAALPRHHHQYNKKYHDRRFSSSLSSFGRWMTTRIICQVWKRLSLFKLLLLVLAVAACVHRLYARYEGHRVFVHAPIHTIERSCPEPSYPTLQNERQQQQKESQNQQPQQYSYSNPKICLTTLTDEQERSKLQRWMRWRDFDGLLEMTWANKQAYADQYGYFLFDESMGLDRSRPPSWSKIKAAKRLLVEENCTWVWWVDADTVIMNSHKRIEDFLPAAEAPQDLLLSQDHSGGYNAGGWLIRNSPYALEFLDEWWSMKHYVKPPGLAKSGDNDAFKAMLATLPEFDQHILVPPRCTFNSFAYFITQDKLDSILSGDGAAAVAASSEQQQGSSLLLTQQTWYRNEAFYHKGDLLAHVAGYNNKEQPVSMLLDIAD